MSLLNLLRNPVILASLSSITLARIVVIFISLKKLIHGIRTLIQTLQFHIQITIIVVRHKLHLYNNHGNWLCRFLSMFYQRFLKYYNMKNKHTTCQANSVKQKRLPRGNPTKKFIFALFYRIFYFFLHFILFL